VFADEHIDASGWDDTFVSKHVNGDDMPIRDSQVFFSRLFEPSLDQRFPIHGTDASDITFGSRKTLIMHVPLLRVRKKCRLA
jgi:hypothetical protein